MSRSDRPFRRRALAGTAAAALLVAVPSAATAGGPRHGGDGPDHGDGLEVETIAHRGAAKVTPENTIAGLEYAAATKAELIEVDVQLSADGVPIVFHDAALTRTTDAEEVFPDRDSYAVTDFTWAELQQLDAGEWFHPDFVGEPIPRLEDTVRSLRGPSGINIELKDPAASPGLEQAVADVIGGHGRWRSLIARDALVVTSFDLDSLATFHDLRPDVLVGGIGAVPEDDATLEAYADWMVSWTTNYRILDPADVGRIQDAGMDAVVYTVNSPAHLEEVAALGVDGIVTDVPQVLERMKDGRDPLPDANGVVVSHVEYDPPGSDIQPEDGEYVELTNTTDAPVDVSGWTWIDAVANRLDVGPGYVIPPGGTLRSYVGPGTDTADRFYNDFGRNVLNNDGDSVGVFTADRELVDLYAYYGN